MEQKQKLPKNVRQVGDREERYRIYLEDYVNTYLDKFSEYEGEITFGVLVGNNSVVEGNAYLFIYGAIAVNYVWQTDEIVFSEQSLNYMQQRRRDYFPEGELCGIFVCGDEDCIPSFQVLEELQKRYFPQTTGSLLYLCSREDSVFLYQLPGGFSQLRGHYIYYERNEGMQSFMVEHSRGSRVERIASEPVVEDFREKMMNQKQQVAISGVKIANVACACLTLVVLVLAYYVASGSDRLRQLEQVLDNLVKTNEGAFAGATADASDDMMANISVEYITGGDGKNESSFGAEQSSEEESRLDGASGENQREESGEVSSQDDIDASAGAEAMAVHIVQPGDTLTSISIQYYGDAKHVESIRQRNQLDNTHDIYVGQELYIP